MIIHMSKTNKTIEWFAGLFEGEGSIYRNDKRRQLSMSIKMVDEDTVRSAYKVVGVGSVFTRLPDNNPNHKRIYDWRTGKRNEILEVAYKILPFMGKRRTVQIKKCIDGLSKLPPKRKLKIVGNCGYVKPTECTSSGAKKHLNKGEKPCPDCASANRNYLKRWRLKFYKANK